MADGLIVIGALLVPSSAGATLSSDFQRSATTATTPSASSYIGRLATGLTQRKASSASGRTTSSPSYPLQVLCQIVEAPWVSPSTEHAHCGVEERRYNRCVHP